MAKKSAGKKRGSGAQKTSRSRASERALNAFDTVQGGDDNDMNLSEGEDHEYSKYLTGDVNSEDDEDIDSDEALGSDDDWEEMVGKKKRDEDVDHHVSEDEDPEEYDNIDSNELMSLSQIWDLDDKPSKKQAESDSEEEEEEEEEADDESELSDDSEDEEDIDDEKMKQLRSMIAGDSGRPSTAKKRLEVNNVPEGEYALPTGAKKISLADLTKSVPDSKGLNLVKDKKSKKLSVPLPRRLQQRHDRAAAYELANEQVDKWQDTVKQNRDAEHVQFPINPKPQVEKTTNFTPVAPSNEFESKVDRVLRESALADEKVLSTFEDLAPAKLSKEELEKQLNERRLMRELALREEKKAKRIKKIKSKSYRRVHKKDRERDAEMMEESSDEEDHNTKRAKERMTLKHKNTSKWAKNMIEQGFTKDKETRAEMEEMLRRGEALRQKVQGENASDDEEEEVVNDALDSVDKSKVGKGILGMKFMQEAEAAERTHNQRMIDEDDIFEGDEVENLGRRSFNPETKQVNEQVNEQMEQAAEDMEEEEDRSLTSRLETKKPIVDEHKEEDDGSNPWMNVESKKPLQTSKKIEEPKAKKRNSRRKQQKKEADKPIGMEQTLELVDNNADGQIQFNQRDLVKRAFAGDEVVSQFHETKRQKVADEGDKEIDLTMPGWGGWGGAGFDEDSVPKRKIVKTVKGVAANKRKDAKLANVIINEKQAKKMSKFTASAVPYPFETREQYERSLRMPVGQEWTSRDTHQKLTKPRVLVKQGEVIDPIKAPFK